MQDCVHVCGCSLVFDSGPISAVNLTSSLRGEDETLVERLLDTPLLQEEAGRVPDDGSGDFGGHVHLGSSGTKEEQVNTQGRKGVLDPSQN